VCVAGGEGSIKVLFAAKDNWVPQSLEPEEVKVSTEQLKIRICGWRVGNVSLDDGRSSQATWIQQYMEQQEEVLVYKHVILSLELSQRVVIFFEHQLEFVNHIFG
jgi:hypothetical protein